MATPSEKHEIHCAKRYLEYTETPFYRAFRDRENPESFDSNYAVLKRMEEAEQSLAAVESYYEGLDVTPKFYSKPDSVTLEESRAFFEAHGYAVHTFECQRMMLLTHTSPELLVHKCPVQIFAGAPLTGAAAQLVTESCGEKDFGLRLIDKQLGAGETLLANGAEIYRVQQTMEIIARSYGARSFHVYVLTNGLFASMEDGGAVQSAAVRSTPRVEMNLGRISAVNALSREIVAGRVPLEEAFARLAQIRATRGLPGWLMVSASAFSAACFCYLFGGSAVDAFTALAPGFAVGLFTRALARARTPLNKLVSNMLSAGVVALVSLACVQALGLAGVACSLDKVIIGGIIPLVPGVALTNGIRDVANCDYLSGTIRAIDAVLIAAGIALGVGLVLKGAALLPGVTI